MGHEETSEDSSTLAPPDGGFGWVVLCACFWLNLQVGAAYTMFGVLLLYLPDSFPVSNVIFTSANAFQIMSLALGVFVGPLIKRFGCRPVAIVGNLFILAGLVSCFFVQTVSLFFVAYGLLPGFGYACCMTTGMVAVQEWFDKRRTLAVGMASVGISAGIFAWPSLIRWLASLYGWRGAVLIVAGIELNGIVAGALLRPISQYRVKPGKRKMKSDESEQPSSTPDMSRICEVDINISDKTRPRHQTNLKTPERDTEQTPLSGGNSNYKSESNIAVLHNQTNGTPGMPHTVSLNHRSPSEPHKERQIVGQQNWRSNELKGVMVEVVVTVKDNAATVDGVKFHRNRDEGTTESTGNQGGLQMYSKSQNDIYETTRDEHTNSHQYKQRSISYGGESGRNGDVKKHLKRRKTIYKPREASASVISLSDGFITLPMRDRVASLPSKARTAAHLASFPQDTITEVESNKSTATPKSDGVDDDDDDDDDVGCCTRTTCLGIDHSLACYLPFFLFIVGGCFTTSGHMMPIAYSPIRSSYLGFENDDAVLLVSILGLFNIAGRVFFGWLGDKAFVNRTILYGVSSALTGSATVASSWMRTYILSAVYQALVGFIGGAYHGIQGAVVVDILGRKHLARGVGLFMLAMGLPNVNHIIAGLVIDYTGDPNLLFLVFGCVQLVGGLLVCFIPLVRLRVGPVGEGDEKSINVTAEEDSISLDSL